MTLRRERRKRDRPRPGPRAGAGPDAGPLAEVATSALGPLLAGLGQAAGLVAFGAGNKLPGSFPRASPRLPLPGCGKAYDPSPPPELPRLDLQLAVLAQRSW